MNYIKRFYIVGSFSCLALCFLTCSGYSRLILFFPFFTARGQGGFPDETDTQLPAMAAALLQVARTHFVLRQGEGRESYILVIVFMLFEFSLSGFESGYIL